MKDRWAQRLQTLPPYLFAALDRKKEEMLQRGADLIDLGVGDPDRPTPDFIIAALKGAAEDPANHTYPSYAGMIRFREAVAQWCRRRFRFEVDPESEVIALIGSKEGIAHFPLGVIDPGDLVLVTDPGYPVCRVATQFAGGRVYLVPLKEENGFLPDLDAIPREVAREAKLFFLNYPNNPTSAVATRPFFEELIEFAKANQIILSHDMAYSEVYFDGEPPLSLLEVPGGREVGIEFHSLSKTFNMTGWRIGFAVGHPDLIGALGKVKTHVDSGVFKAVQIAGIAALESDGSSVEEMRRLYQKRRDILRSGLERLGLDLFPTKATFFVWGRVPPGTDSAEFVSRLLEEAAIVATPGVGFGAGGEGYFRMAFTQDTERLQEAVDRIATLRL